jgi:hypothetical protein
VIPSWNCDGVFTGREPHNTHKKMNFWKATGLGAAVIVLVACGMQGPTKQESNSQTKQTEIKKDPKITSAEQLSFILCKKKQGQYMAYHDSDMRKVLASKNIDASILNSGEVKALAQKYVDDGSCDFYAAYDRIWDIVPKEGEGKTQFNDLVGWKREVVVVMSEGECKTQLGEFNNEERENYILTGLEKISYPSDLAEDEMSGMIQSNLPSILWLTREKKRNKNCSWMPVG